MSYLLLPGGILKHLYPPIYVMKLYENNWLQSNDFLLPELIQNSLLPHLTYQWKLLWIFKDPTLDHTKIWLNQ